uniref:Uncharacterized protein n=1 Tax=Rhizophora mucronata TaxID=61149 RepID=A0A2P2LFW2_RHIMU
MANRDPLWDPLFVDMVLVSYRRSRSPPLSFPFVNSQFQDENPNPYKSGQRVREKDWNLSVLQQVCRANFPHLILVFMWSREYKI